MVTFLRAHLTFPLHIHNMSIFETTRMNGLHLYPLQIKTALPFWANFVAGAIAGVTEILTFYPLDVVKTRMQLDTSTKSIGLVGSFRTIIQQEG